MGHRLVEFQAVLEEVRRRWTRLAVLRRWALGSAAAALAILVGLGAVSLVARDGLSLLVAAFVALAAAAVGLGCALWPLRVRPTDLRLARFIEERAGGLDDVLPTAVEYLNRPDQSGPIAEALAADAVRVVKNIDLDTVVDRSDIRQAIWKAAAASAALIVMVTLFSPSLRRAGHVASAYLFPARVTLEVTPGSTKVPAGKELTISARVAGSDGALVPVVTVGKGDSARTVRMERVGDDRYEATLADLTASFPYLVSAASTRSPEYTVTVIRPPQVERIDLHLDFPAGLGLKPRTEEDSGDIYGPAGTKVRVTVTADKPIARGHLTLADGSTVPLDGNEHVLDAGLTIQEDGSYRVALADTDGLESAGDTEYFIRTLLDRPPDVRIMRPGGDKQVTSLEEVAIEARADDDFGIQSFDLVFQKPGEPEKAVPFRGERGGLTVTGTHTMFLEDLGVQPGDFLTYYARARDVGRGRTTSEARSDIFFLEVKPFEEEFVAAQSQAMAQGGMSGSGMQELAEAQKEIIVATWKLDARGRRARDARSKDDIKAVGKAQSDLKARVDRAAGAMNRTMADPRRRRFGGGAQPRPAPVDPSADNPMAKAAEAMGRAVTELDKTSTAGAIPHEMEALNQLLKADAEVRRRQVARQQGGGGGGAQNRQGPDLSALFDQELRKRQATNYETPNSTESREDQSQQEDPLERIRELARRQDALNRQQKDLAQNRDRLEEEELKRQLERLTREQNELRQQAEQLARQMQSNRQQGGQQQSQGSRGEQQANGSQLREISEEMRDAATDLRRQDPSRASERGDRALERLRDLERQIQTANPDDRRRAMGDLQLETRQLADAQRRLANEAERTAAGEPGRDARRRLAAEQDRLAERLERLNESARQLSRGGQGDAKEQPALAEAARELDRQKLSERMRQSAKDLRQPGGQGGEGETGARAAEQQAEREAQAAAQGEPEKNAAGDREQVARALDAFAEQLGMAAGAATAESRRDSDSLSNAQELRERMAELQRSIEQMEREGRGQQSGSPSQGQQPSRDQQNAQQGQQGQQQGNQAGQSGQRGQQQGQQGQQAGAQGESTTAQGAGGGGGGGRLGELQRQAGEQAREVERLADRLRRDNPGMQGPNTAEDWWPSTSAPGTETWKQDFARWESLKKGLLSAVEKLETDVSSRQRERENRERLNAGGHDAVSEAYREQVERYFRALAAPRKPPQ